ncbi:MAG: hypothetical protein ACK53Z_12870 [Betaproteobacteria bacterium]|jgi:hypothetical protein
MNKTRDQIDKENEEFCERQLQEAKRKVLLIETSLKPHCRLANQ